MSSDEVLNNTIVFEEEYENSLVAIGKQLEHLGENVLKMKKEEDDFMVYTTSQDEMDVWMVSSLKHPISQSSGEFDPESDPKL